MYVHNSLLLMIFKLRLAPAAINKTGRPQAARTGNQLAIANVHCYFKAETHFSSCWFCPHNNLLVID
jgi:hypothetical protein